MAERLNGVETVISFDLCTGEYVKKDETKKIDISNIKDIETALNQADYLHLQERVFSDPGYEGQEYFISVGYKADAGADTLETFNRMASCSTSCSADLMKIINLLKNIK